MKEECEHEQITSEKQGESTPSPNKKEQPLTINIFQLKYIFFIIAYKSLPFFLFYYWK